MQPYLTERFGNPSSAHEAGRAMKAGLDLARTQVASLIGAQAGEIVFTASGTEANNQVIKGLAHRFRDRSPHMVISAIEHPAIENPCRFLESYGVRTSRVRVDSTGLVNPDDIRRALTPSTVLVSIMQANNEVGTIQPIRAIADVAHAAGVLMHTDAAQSLGKIPVKVNDLGVDLLSIAGHKVYAPQGVGALYVRSGIELPPLLHGAGHERGRRAGTEAVPAIVGLGAAANLASAYSGQARLAALRDRLWDGLRDRLGARVRLNGHPVLRLPNTLNVSFQDRVGGEWLSQIPELCASAGAACHSGSAKPSAVLTAMGIEPVWALGAVRFSLLREATADEVDRCIELVSKAYESPAVSSDDL